MKLLDKRWNLFRPIYKMKRAGQRNRINSGFSDQDLSDSIQLVSIPVFFEVIASFYAIL